MTTWKEFKETMEAIEKVECWNDFDTEVYEGLCEFAGLDYHKYDDPDKMWDDLVDFARSHEKETDLAAWWRQELDI